MNHAEGINVKQVLAQKAKSVELWLEKSLDDQTIPDGLRESMLYSLLAGGKRIRPVLCLTCAKMLGQDENTIMPFAAAFEFIHTYSLIHDDLPAMDDDDLRRGKPSNHKKFNEATAILAGDALLTDAFQLMSQTPVPSERLVKAMACAAVAAGSKGMVGGQFLDVLHTGSPAMDMQTLMHIHVMKTGALLTSPCKTGAILAGACDNDILAMEQFGQHIGAAFQIMDDILDEVGTEEELGKPVGSDQAAGKHTYPSLVGLQKSREMAADRTKAAIACLESYQGPEAEFLRALARYISNRIS